jgi:N-hydroxyarylamine O-acetyltransferase
MHMFDPSAFDLSAYLTRIGYGGSTTPTLDTLRGITLAHPMAIPFENLDPFLRRPVALDVDALQRKLVRGGRGGYCFEHNVLLGTALRAIGFDVTGLAARVMWNAPPGVVTPRSHMLLRLLVDGQPYVADAGFGGLTLTGPLRFEAGLEQATPHERFRIVADGDGFIMQAFIQEAWKSLYWFDRQPQVLADYEVSSWYLCNHPRSHFVTGLMAARVERDRRYALRNAELAAHHRDGTTERRMVSSGVELRDVLSDVFRIRVPEGGEVDAAFDRFVGGFVQPQT